MFGRGFAFDLYEDGYDLGMGGFGSRYTFGGDVDRRGFAAVSNRALEAKETATTIFLNHLATVDISSGPVTTEIIKFHLVPDMKKAFNKFVKEHGCMSYNVSVVLKLGRPTGPSATSRKLTRQEQDQINKSRKSLMQFTSVKVTPEAQHVYLEKHPEAKGKNRAASAAGPSTMNSAAPLDDITSKKRDANQAGLEASGSSTGAVSKKANLKA